MPSKKPLFCAALIKAVYEVDPLKCPKCGGTMNIVSFIVEEDVIRKILKSCDMWKETPSPHPPPILFPPADMPTGLTYDTEFTSAGGQ